MRLKYRISTFIAVLFSIGLWHSVAFATIAADRFKGTILELLFRTDGAQALAAAVEVGEEAGCLPTIAQTLDSTSDAIDRIPDGSEYRPVGGTLVADDKADLADGLLKVELNQSQYGTLIQGLVWTGTGPDGRSTGSNCSNWTSQTDARGCDLGGDPNCGTVGANNERGPKWTDLQLQTCSSAAAIYCFGILD